MITMNTSRNTRASTRRSNATPVHWEPNEIALTIPQDAVSLTVAERLLVLSPQGKRYNFEIKVRSPLAGFFHRRLSATLLSLKQRSKNIAIAREVSRVRCQRILQPRGHNWCVRAQSTSGTKTLRIKIKGTHAQPESNWPTQTGTGKENINMRDQNHKWGWFPSRLTKRATRSHIAITKSSRKKAQQNKKRTGTNTKGSKWVVLATLLFHRRLLSLAY